MIAPELHARIRQLFFAEHWRLGTIAAELGLHRDAVCRVVDTGSFVRAGAIVRPSMLDPFKPFIAEVLEQHPRLRATRIFEMLKPRGYTGSAVQLRRYLREVRPVPRSEAFLRLSTFPGEQAQVDWGHFGKIRVGHAERPLSCLVMVLSWSRALFARFTLDQTLESFQRGHVEAFAAFGGVPRSIPYDNLKSVVLERAGDHTRFNENMLFFAGHHHFAPKPCAPYRGNEKGKVERAIQYLRHSFFAARRFSSVQDLNAQLTGWIERIADARKVPSDPQQRLVRDRLPLVLVASESTVRITNGAGRVFAEHARCWDHKHVIEDPAHVAELAREKRHAHDLRGRDRLRATWAAAEPFLDAVVLRGGNLGSQVTRLLKLLDTYGANDLDAAMRNALDRGAVSAASVAHILDQQARSRRVAPKLDVVLPDDPRVRDLRVTPHSLDTYDALCRREDEE